VEIPGEATGRTFLLSRVKISFSQVLLLFTIVIAIQLFYYIYFFCRLANYDSSPVASENLPPVSIVICAHDEMNGLRKNLPSILEQKYPHYEVIVVNDNSEDDTEMILMQLQAKYPHLVVRDIRTSSKNMRGKKYPLTIGIRAALNEHVLLTDADCAPSGDHWIREMAAMFQPGKEIVIGYAPYRKHPGFLNKFIRYETFTTALQYFSFALAHIPYMGVGRNLAYQKNVFFDHNIYPRYPQLLSGDDDLLINAAANKQNTAIQINKSAFMFSEPKETWDEYWHQKRRHISTGRYYKLSHRFLLMLFPISSLFFYILLFLCLFYTTIRVETLLLFIIKTCIQGIVFRENMKKLGEEDLFFLFPLMDILFLLYYLRLLPFLITTRETSWK
jgi:cellulose synthase/poly-beta-1,6-N-acetylglucosamine synthase-like glycosyltransferase